MTRLTAIDAQAFWLSSKVPSDEFFLYVFDGVPADLDAVLMALADRAAACPDLCRRIVDKHALRYPQWVACPVGREQFVVHPGGLSWIDCLDAVAGVMGDQLDAAQTCWRLHVFPAVAGAPRVGRAAVSEPAVTVAVLQIAHSLADGTRTAELAGWLFGRDRRPDPIGKPRGGNMLWCGVQAARTQRQLDADVAAGRVPPPAPSRPLLCSNTRPDGVRRLRTLVRDRAALDRQVHPDATITVTVLGAIGAALAGHVRARGEDPSLLGAEVPMANAGIRLAYNNFRNVGVGLHPASDVRERAGMIAAELRDARIRGTHRAVAAQRRAVQATPAVLLRWGVGQFDPAVRVAAVTGNTVVSSVNGGAVDLRLGAAPVLFAAVYPGLSSMMSLTHGVQGIGNAVAISVHAAEPAFGPDELDDYLVRLDHALG
jgi:hypothetical protein